MQHYTDTDFVRLIDEVERQGGEYLSETCMADELAYKLPNGRMTTTLGNGCEEDALFMVAFDPNETVVVNEPILEKDPRPGVPLERKRQVRDENNLLQWNAVTYEGEGEELGIKHLIKVCANDDLMREWPRFRNVMEHRDPSR